MYRLNEELMSHHDSFHTVECDAQGNRFINAKSFAPVIDTNYLDSEMEASNQDLPANYDPNRRSSLGAESLMEHDMNEETGNLDDYSESIYSEAQLGLEYADDIFILHKCNEHLHHPRNYIQKQSQITVYMRCTLINWLVKVNHELKFGPETIFIAVNLTDRFLESTPIAQDCLQLLAVCALFVAAKLEESVIPGISVLVTLCGYAYKHYHFKRMENLLLSTLRFRLYSPTSWFFVTYITLKSCQAIPLDKRALCLARYTIETCLSNYMISQFFPSEQAASALSFSCLVLYSPNSVYPMQSNEPYNLSTVYENHKENLLETLSSLNGFSMNLLWTLKEIFSPEESNNIINCIGLMKDYMKPFLQSFDSGSIFLSANDLPFKEKMEDKQAIAQKSIDIRKTVSHSVYNEDKESFERVEVLDPYANSSKYSSTSSYDETSSGIRRYEKHRILDEFTSSKWDVHSPSRVKKAEAHNDELISIFDYVLERNASNSCPSDWNGT